MLSYLSRLQIIHQRTKFFPGAGERKGKIYSHVFQQQIPFKGHRGDRETRTLQTNNG